MKARLVNNYHYLYSSSTEIQEPVWFVPEETSTQCLHNPDPISTDLPSEQHHCSLTVFPAHASLCGDTSYWNSQLSEPATNTAPNYTVIHVLHTEKNPTWFLVKAVLGLLPLYQLNSRLKDSLSVTEKYFSHLRTFSSCTGLVFAWNNGFS